MKRIDTSTAQKNLFGLGKHGFKGGDPTGGDPATELDPDWFNAVQEEVAVAVESLCGGLNDSLTPQLGPKLVELFAGKFGAFAWQGNGVNANTVAAPGIYGCSVGASNTPTAAGTLIHTASTNTALQGAQIWITSGGIPNVYVRNRTAANTWSNWRQVWVTPIDDASDSFTSIAQSGFQKLPTGLILQWGLVTDSLDATDGRIVRAVTFPTRFRTALLNVNITMFTDHPLYYTARDVQCWASPYANPIGTYPYPSINQSQDKFYLVYEESSPTPQQFKLSWMAIGH